MILRDTICALKNRLGHVFLYADLSSKKTHS